MSRHDGRCTKDAVAPLQGMMSLTQPQDTHEGGPTNAAGFWARAQHRSVRYAALTVETSCGSHCVPEHRRRDAEASASN